jgi:hypothetical protein
MIGEKHLVICFRAFDKNLVTSNSVYHIGDVVWVADRQEQLV